MPRVDWKARAVRLTARQWELASQALQEWLAQRELQQASGADPAELGPAEPGAAESTSPWGPRQA